MLFRSPATAAAYASMLYVVKNAEAINAGKLNPAEIGVRAIDAKTLEITLERPTPFFLELLAHQTVEIERVAIGQHVDAMPTIREEGDTIVIPIVEEVLVIERRLLLKEEVRVQRVRSMERHQESVTLRHHEAVVTRLPVEPPAPGEATEAGTRVPQSKQEE